jgi:hypothetical protein
LILFIYGNLIRKTLSNPTNKFIETNYLDHLFDQLADTCNGLEHRRTLS